MTAFIYVPSGFPQGLSCETLHRSSILCSPISLELAGAIDDQAAIVHSGNASPDCSRTMYLAYQSGQLGSDFPIRCSC
jgi:hypothetical protein